MGVRRLLGMSHEERRRSPRIRCRLRCTLRRGRRRVRARVLDVSEGGLCVLSPVPLQPKQTLVVQIDVPPRGPVEVEAIAWHVRQVKTGSSGRKAYSIGMILSKAGPGFETLLPGGSEASGAWAADALAEKLGDMAGREGAAGNPSSSQDAPEVTALEEDALSADELDGVDLDLLSPSELQNLAQAPPSSEPWAPGPDDTLKLFRIRVKAHAGPRTRTLTLGAVSASEAEVLAGRELGDDWQILEVTPA